MKQYVVESTAEEREQLLQLTRKGRTPARRLKRALVLLAADEGVQDRTIAEQVRVHWATVERIRQRFVTEGLAAALAERPRPGKARLLDGRQEAHLVALACSEPPPGHQRWTMRLLARRLVDLEVVEAISDETVRRARKTGR